MIDEVILVNIKKVKNIKIKRQQHIGFVTSPPVWVYFRRAGGGGEQGIDSQSQSAAWGLFSEDPAVRISRRHTRRGQ